MRILRKSVLFLFLVVTLAIGLFAAACGEKSVTLSFVTNGGSEVAEIVATPGETVDLPVPSKEGAEFGGWYAASDFSGDPLGTTLVAPEEDATYYAKWTDLPVLTLNPDGGTVDGTKFYLAAGQDLYSFMQNHVPQKAGYEFGKWMIGDKDLTEGAKMPAEGATLTAVWKVPYTLNIYKENVQLNDYVPDEQLTVTGFDYVGTQITERPSIEHFLYNGEKSTTLTLIDGENTANLYYDRDVYYVVFYANAPSGEDADGQMEDLEYSYESDVTVPDSAFHLFGYRFLGWAEQEGGDVVYRAGETFPMEDNLYLYAVWDTERYTDALGGTDYLFLDDLDETAIYLQRYGLPELKGTLGENRIFTFSLAGGGELKGRLNDARMTFSYLADRLQGHFTLYSVYESIFEADENLLDPCVDLELLDYDSATLRLYAAGEDGVRGELQTEIAGEYNYDSYWEDFSFRAHGEVSDPRYSEFNFQIYYSDNEEGIRQFYFSIQGDEVIESGEAYDNGYYSVTQSGTPGFPYVVLDGYGTAYMWEDEESYAIYSYVPARIAAEAFGLAYSRGLDTRDDEIALLRIQSGMIYLSYAFRYYFDTATSEQTGPVTLGFLKFKDSFYGMFDAETETGTERLILDGYGGAVYGTVEDGEFTQVSSGTYVADGDASFVEYYYNEAEDVERYLTYNYFALVYVDGEGNASRWRLGDVPSVSGGELVNGTMFRLSDNGTSEGRYTVVNGFTMVGQKGTSAFLSYPLTTQYLYLSGMNYQGMEGYAEFWATNDEAAEAFYDRVGVYLYELVAYGSTHYNKEDGVWVFEVNEDGKYNDIFSWSFEFTIDEAARTVTILTRITTFEASDGTRISLGRDGSATTQDGTPATYTKISLEAEVNGGFYGFIYTFTVNDKTYTFFQREAWLTGILSEPYEIEAGRMQHSKEMNNSGNFYSVMYREKAEEDGQQYAIVLTYYSINGWTYAAARGTIAPSGNSGDLYTFKATEGGKINYGSYNGYSAAAQGSFYFKYDEDGFRMGAQTSVIPTNAAINSRETKEKIGTLVSDNYGNAVYTDENGVEHKGTAVRTFYGYHNDLGNNLGADSFFGSSMSANSRYIFTFTEESTGKAWRFLGINNTTLYEMYDDEGAYFDATGNNAYYFFFFNGEVYSAPATYSGSSYTGGSDFGGTYTAYEETETEGDYLLKLYGYRSEQSREAIVLLQDDFTYLLYQEPFDFDYDIILGRDAETAEKAGHLDGNGYSLFVYTDENDVEHEIASLRYDADTKILLIGYYDEAGQAVVYTYDIVELSDGTVCAWVRTEAQRVVSMGERDFLGDTMIVTDGHGNALFYPTGNETEEEAIAGHVEEISYNEAIFRFVAEEEESLSFTFQMWRYDTSTGTTFYFYIRYFDEFETTLLSIEDYTALLLDGYDGAIYIDGLGRRYEGNYYVLGEKKSVILFESDRTGYVYYNTVYTDGALTGIRPIEGDFVIEDNVLLGYRGGAEVKNIPAGVDTIGEQAFVNLAITSIDLSGIKYIEKYAFYDVMTLETITHPESLISIGDFAFYNDVRLGYLADGAAIFELPALQTIGESAFEGALALGGIETGAAFTHAGDYAFYAAGRGHSLGLRFGLHTGADADYDNMFGLNVFDDSLAMLYVDSVSIAKAIYDSSLDVQYASETQQYYELLRVANELNGAEFGYYMRSDLHYASHTSGNMFIRLDGMLLGDGYYNTSAEPGYVNTLYEITADGTFSAATYDPETGTGETITGTYDKETKKLTINNIQYAFIGDNLNHDDIIPVVYTNTLDPEETLTITPWLSISNGSFSVNAFSTAPNLITSIVYKGKDRTVEGRWGYTAGTTANSSGVYFQGVGSNQFSWYVEFGTDFTFTFSQKRTYYYANMDTTAENAVTGNNYRMYLYETLNSERTGYDLSISSSARFWLHDPETNVAYDINVVSAESAMKEIHLEGNVFTATAEFSSRLMNDVENLDQKYEITLTLDEERSASGMFTYSSGSVKVIHGVEFHDITDGSIEYLVGYLIDNTAETETVEPYCLAYRNASQKTSLIAYVSKAQTTINKEADRVTVSATISGQLRTLWSTREVKDGKVSYTGGLVEQPAE